MLHFMRIEIQRKTVNPVANVLVTAVGKITKSPRPWGERVPAPPTYCLPRNSHIGGINRCTAQQYCITQPYLSSTTTILLLLVARGCLDRFLAGHAARRVRSGLSEQRESKARKGKHSGV